MILHQCGGGQPARAPLFFFSLREACRACLLSHFLPGIGWLKTSGLSLLAFPFWHPPGKGWMVGLSCRWRGIDGSLRSTVARLSTASTRVDMPPRTDLEEEEKDQRRPDFGAVQISQCMVASSKTLDPRPSTLSDRSGLLAAARHAKNREPRGFRIKYRGAWLNQDAAAAQGWKQISPNGCPSRKM